MHRREQILILCHLKKKKKIIVIFEKYIIKTIAHTIPNPKLKKKERALFVSKFYANGDKFRVKKELLLN